MTKDTDLPREVRSKLTDLSSLCLKFHVSRLELFGSGASGGFHSKTSDLDFLVEFQDMDPVAYAEAYFGLLEALEKLFGQPIDMVVKSAITNPFFRQKVESEKALLYAA